MTRRSGSLHQAAGELATGELEPLPIPLDLTVEAIEAGGELLVLFTFSRERDVPSPLTEAERDIAGLALQGLSTAQIATMRGVARTTVSSQLQSIYRKLGIASRAELACKLG